MGKRKLGGMGMGTSTVGSQLSALNSSKRLGRDGLIGSGGGLGSNSSGSGNGRGMNTTKRH